MGGREKPTEQYLLETDPRTVSDVRTLCMELQQEFRAQGRRVSELEAVVAQLTEERPRESVDERRVHILKCQVIQLERQIAVLYDALKQRTGVINDAASQMDKSVSDLRLWVDKDRGSSQVTVDRSVLISNVEKLNSAKQQLFASSQILDSSSLSNPILYHPRASSLSEDEPLTLLDICLLKDANQKLQHLDLSKLECNMSETYHTLSELNSSLSVLANPLVMIQTSCADCISLSIEKLQTQVANALGAVASCMRELLLLMMLFPNATTLSAGPRKKKPPAFPDPMSHVTCDSVYKALTPYMKSSNTLAVKTTIESLMEAIVLQLKISNLEKQSSDYENKFHSSIFELQIKYQSDLFNLVGKAFDDFNRDLKTQLCDPLAEVLDQYERLKSKPSDDSLKRFVATFKAHADQMQQANTALLLNDDKGQSAISEFGSGFIHAVRRLRKQRSKELKEEVLQLEDARNDLKRFLIYDETFERQNGGQSRQSSARAALLQNPEFESTSPVARTPVPLPDIHRSPPASRPHGLPSVKCKRKAKANTPSSHNPLPDMQF